MNYSILDLESDGLIETVTKIHCLSVHQFKDGVERKFSLVNYEDMVNFVLNEENLVGHNIIRYDVPVLEKILGIKITAYLIDTLGLSWYLYPNRHEHGLESWGEDVGVEKPKVLDWSNAPIEEYVFRCEKDVEINVLTFHLMMDYLRHLYDDNKDKIKRLIGYLMFKLDCAREQEEVKWRVDVAKCTANLELLHTKQQEKVDVLRGMMPLVTIYKMVARPKTLYKKDGTPSVVGQRWLDLLREKGFPEYHLGTIKVPVKEVPANPGSHAQLKSWLFSLGWIPDVFKYEKEDDGTIRRIPQLSEDGVICESVKLLYDVTPDLHHLEGLFIVRHRIGILEGFLRVKDENDFVKAEIGGFTNTLRFQHRVPVVNLPQVPKPYWEEVRGCLIAPDDNHILCGSDMSGLEDNTKRHYMYYYDPEYVKEMMTYGFDAHCDISALSGKMSRDEEAFYKWHTNKKEGGDYERIQREYLAKRDPLTGHNGSATGFTFDELLAMSPEDQNKQMKILKPIRLRSKKVNFSGVYGAGPPKIALTGGFPLAEAKILHTIYWKRNWSVKKIAEACVVKTIGHQMWLFNPVSQFWYSLRVEKDKFSTLNQGTGVYCFDSWIRNVRKKDVKICGQFHDEHIAPILKGTEENHRLKLQTAIQQTNQELQLNVQLGISIDFGNSYAEIH